MDPFDFEGCNDNPGPNNPPVWDGIRFDCFPNNVELLFWAPNNDVDAGRKIEESAYVF